MKFWKLFIHLFACVWLFAMSGCFFLPPSQPCSAAVEMRMDAAPDSGPDSRSDSVSVSDAQTQDSFQVFLPDARSTDATISDVLMPDASTAEASTSGVTQVLFMDMAILVMPVEASRCRDGTLHLPAEFLGSDIETWHVCYTTPDPHTNPTLSRASTVTFTLVTELAAPVNREFMWSMSAPRTANPWTAGLLIGIPRHAHLAPQINAMLDLPSGGSFWAVASNMEGTGLVQLGTFRFWSIDASGHKTPQMPWLLADHCFDPSMPDLTLAGDAFPVLATCPDALAFCGTGPTHCP